MPCQQRCSALWLPRLCQGAAAPAPPSRMSAAPPPQGLMQPRPRCQQLLPTIRLQLAPQPAPHRAPHTARDTAEGTPRAPPMPTAPQSMGPAPCLHSFHALWPDPFSPCTPEPQHAMSSKQPHYRTEQPAGNRHLQPKRGQTPPSLQGVPSAVGVTWVRVGCPHPGSPQWRWRCSRWPWARLGR